MPDATTTKTQQEESIIQGYLRAQAHELLKGRDGAASRMILHPTLGLATPAEAKFARQYGWDEYRRY